jgi:hypothetical protein
MGVCTAHSDVRPNLSDAMKTHISAPGVVARKARAASRSGQRMVLMHDGPSVANLA